MALTLLFFAAAERYPERRRLFLAADVLSRRLGDADQGAGRGGRSRRWCSRSTSSCIASSTRRDDDDSGRRR